MEAHRATRSPHRGGSQGTASGWLCSGEGGPQLVVSQTPISTMSLRKGGGRGQLKALLGWEHPAWHRSCSSSLWRPCSAVQLG